MGPLLPGLVDMACEAAVRGRGRPTWLVPLAWRYEFTGDARRGLARDMASLERGLSLPAGRTLAAPDRFAALMRNVLARQCERLGLAVAGAGYFAAQTAVLDELKRDLSSRYGPLDDDVVRAQFQLRRAMRERAASDPDGVRRDRARLAELQRLANLDPALYDRAELDQERVAEILKRTRSFVLTRGLANALHNTVPVAAGSRVVHVRVAEPIAVGPGDATEASRDALLAEHRRRLQRIVDQLGAELAPRAARFRLANPLHGR